MHPMTIIRHYNFPAAPYQEADDEDDGSVADGSNECGSKLRRWTSQRCARVCSRSTLFSLFPITVWLRKYSRADLLGDLVAGLTVGLTVLPQGIAYAILAGLPANYGLYSAFIGCFVYCILGSTSAITIGPTAIMALMTHEYGYHGNQDVAVLLALFTGVVVTTASLLQLGFLIEFMSSPVVTGFTSAAAITIASSQLKGVFGIKVDGDSFIDQYRSIIAHLSDTNLADLLLGVCCIILLIVMREMRRLLRVSGGGVSGGVVRWLCRIVRLVSISRNAILVLAASVMVAVLQAYNMRPFTLTASVEAGLPVPRVPRFSSWDSHSNTTLYFWQIGRHVGVGFAIVPLLAVIEGVAIAKAFSNGKRVDATQEMLALGACNLVGAFFSSMPVTGSFSRTAVNHASGVRTPLGGIFTGVLVMLALQFLTPYFVYIPKATLSAVIICAVIYMIELDVVKPMWRSRKIDLVPFFVTFFTCILWGLEFGIGVGSAISLAMILFKAARPKIVVREQHLAGTSHVYIYVSPDSGLTYPAAEHVRAVVAEAALVHGGGRQPVLLDCNNVRYTDFTSAECMNLLVREFHARGQLLVFANMKPSIARCWDGAVHGIDGATCRRLSCASIADAEAVFKEHLQPNNVKIDDPAR